jgi:hypothetical protein
MIMTRASLEEARRAIEESFLPHNYREFLRAEARERNRFMLLGGVPVVSLFATIGTETVEWLPTGEVRTCG